MNTPFKTALAISALILVTFGGCSNDDNNRFGGQPLVVGSGTIADEPRMVSGFTGVTMTAVGDIHIAQGGVEGLVIRADDNLLQYVRTEVVNNTLEITFEPGVILQPTQKFEFELDLIDLDNLLISGVATIDAPSLDSNQLRIVNSGVGTIDLNNLTVTDLDVVNSGVSQIRLSGTTDTQLVVVSGTGPYSAENLQSREAEVLIGGMGSATVRVSDLLTATITGSGNIDYYGDPTVVPNVTGSGKITRLGP